MTADQLAIYQKHTGRAEAPTEPFREAWLIIGRRGGKSFIMALVAVYLACFRDYRQYLAPGEHATVAIIAADRRQARVCMRYIRALISLVPTLKKRLRGKFRSDGVDLQNQVTIEVGTASLRTTRGYTYAAVICDEIAFWRVDDDSANPDVEILKAIGPGLLTIPTSLLMCASSPHARRGALYDAFRRYFGKETRRLVWKAATIEMNPTADKQAIAEAYEDDPSSAAAEFGGEFRSDIEVFVTREVVERCVSEGVFERPRIVGVSYFAFTDPSGGSNDSMTLVIGHAEGGKVVIDALRERKPPFSPEAVVIEFCETIKAYGVSSVTGDRYAGEWPREQFRKQGIAYKLAEKPRSDLYLALLPTLNSRTVDLLDTDKSKLVNQIVGLERRMSRSGKESIDHAPNSHDDLANAVAGVVAHLSTERERIVPAFGTYGISNQQHPLVSRYGFQAARPF